MILARVEGTVVATQKDEHLRHNRLLVVQPVDLEYKSIGASMVALDVVDAGEGDLVLVMKEGGSARMIFNDPEMPLQSVVVAVIDRIDAHPDILNTSWPKTSSKE